MASISTSTPAPNSYNARGICQIVGFVCLAGFAFDMLILSLPPDPGSVQWRVSTVQQFADRSIILLFGSALTLFGSLNKRQWLRQFSRFCLLAGVAFLLLCFLAIADSLSLQQQAVNTITSQETQLQTQIRNAQDNPSSLGKNVTPEDLKRAADQLTTQANTLRQTAKTTSLKTGASSVANLFTVGLGLVGLGRYGLSLRTR